MQTQSYYYPVCLPHCQLPTQAFNKTPAPAKRAAAPTAAVFIGAAAPVNAIGAPPLVLVYGLTPVEAAVPLGTEAVGADGLTAGGLVPTDLGIDDELAMKGGSIGLAVTVTTSVTGGGQVVPLPDGKTGFELGRAADALWVE